MPEASLRLRPGVNVEFTPTLNESGISACNYIRFKAGLPEKLGGWTKFYPFTVSGVPKALHAWSDLNAVPHLAVAATLQLSVITNGTQQDITPQTLISDTAVAISTTLASTTVGISDPNIANVTVLDSVFFNTPVSVGGIILQGIYPITLITGTSSYEITAADAATSTVVAGGAVPDFTTVSGSAVVLVDFDDHGLSVGSRFTFPIPTVVGGVTVSGTYVVASVPTANSFTIAANTQATSSTTDSMNGGLAQYVYYITIGPQALGVGYGLGGYGEGGYGTGIVPSSQTGTPITATDWTLDNWGEIVLACPRGGGIYYWSPNAGLVNADLADNAPIFNNGIFVAMPEQILVAWGSIASGIQQDPLTVRWSDSLDFTIWAVTSQTQAGSFRIPTGSEIIGGMQATQQALIWTDLDVYSMTYLGPPLVFGFNKISSGCGLIGPHAMAEMRGVVYWMSSGNFFKMGGAGVQQVDCSVWDKVFQNLDTANQRKCVAAPNSAFDEMWFFYPSLSGGTGEIDSYVKINTESGAWDYGSMPRTAWIDQSVLGEPIAATPTGIIYQHETSPDADGQPLNAWFETGWFVIAEGQQFPFVDWLFPDMKFGYSDGAQTATILMTIYAADYPNGTIRPYGPFTMTQATSFINLRLRGRQIKIRIESNDIGSFWRLGLPRYRVQQMGRR